MATIVLTQNYAHCCLFYVCIYGWWVGYFSIPPPIVLPSIKLIALLFGCFTHILRHPSLALKYRYRKCKLDGYEIINHTGPFNFVDIFKQYKDKHIKLLAMYVSVHNLCITYLKRFWLQMVTAGNGTFERYLISTLTVSSWLYSLIARAVIR